MLSRVHAQSASAVALQLPRCLDASRRDALVESVRLELGSDGAVLVDHERATPDTTRIAIELACDEQPQRARVGLLQAGEAPQSERWVELADVPVALRARTVALALAELWRSSAVLARESTVGTAVQSVAASGSAGALRSAASVPGSGAPGASTRGIRSGSRASAARSEQTEAVASPASGAGTRDGSYAADGGDSADARGSASGKTDAAAASAREKSTLDAMGSGRGGTAGRGARAEADAVDGGGGRSDRAGAGVREEPAAEVDRPLAVGADSHARNLVDADDAVAGEDASSARPGLALSVAPALRLFLQSRDVLPGAQLTLRWRAWRLGAEGFYGGRSDALGDARFGILQGLLSWELLRVRFGAYGLALGPRAAVGGMLAKADATAPLPAHGGSSTVLSWDVAGEAAFWRELSDRWSLDLRVNIGYARGVRLVSDVGELASLHGLFASASLAIELQVID